MFDRTQITGIIIFQFADHNMKMFKNGGGGGGGYGQKGKTRRNIKQDCLNDQNVETDGQYKDKS